jgi:hypothetical protein
VLTAIGDARAGRQWAWGWTYPNSTTGTRARSRPRRSRTYPTARAERDESRTRLLDELERRPEDAGPFGPDTWDPGKSEIGWMGSPEREHAEMIAAL